MILCSWVLLVLFIIILSLMGWSWCCFSSCYCFHHDPVFLSASDAVDHDPVTHWTRFWCWFLGMLLFHHDPVFLVRSWCFSSWFCDSRTEPDAVFYRCCYNSWSCDFWVILLLFIMILSLIDILMQSWWLFPGKFSWSCWSSWSCVL